MPRVRKYKNVTEPKWGKSEKKKPRSAHFSFGDFLLKLFALAGAAALLLAYVSVYLKPSDLSSVLMFFGLYFIPILAFNLVVFIVALIRLRYIAFLSFLVMLPTLFYADLFVKLGGEETVPEGKPFKMLTYNVGKMELSLDKQTAAANIARVEEFLKQENPDIVCLQEFSMPGLEGYENFLTKLPNRFQYFVTSKPLYGNVILSRYPVLDGGHIKFENSSNMCIWADLDIDGQVLRVYNCHLQSNSISFTSLIQRMATKGELKSEVREVHDKLRGSNKVRAQQVEDILAHCSQCEYPVIICGDFNDTPVSHTYYKLHKGRKDSFAEAGEGFGASYAYFWPFLRIDYILFPKEYSAYRNEIKREKYSDHYPVITHIYR